MTGLVLVSSWTRSVHPGRRYRWYNILSADLVLSGLRLPSPVSSSPAGALFVAPIPPPVLYWRQKEAILWQNWNSMELMK